MDGSKTIHAFKMHATRRTECQRESTRPAIEGDLPHDADVSGLTHVDTRILNMATVGKVSPEGRNHLKAFGTSGHRRGGVPREKKVWGDGIRRLIRETSTSRICGRGRSPSPLVRHDAKLISGANSE